MVLVGQVELALVVEGLYVAGGAAEEVLQAAIRGEVVIVARELGDLDDPFAGGGPSGITNVEREGVALVGGVNVH